MTAPLQVLLAVEADAQPVIDVLQRHSHDIGSLKASRFFANAPEDMRLLCVAVVDGLGVQDLARQLKDALRDQPEALALVRTVQMVPGPLGTTIVVFPDIAAIGVTGS